MSSKRTQRPAGKKQVPQTKKPAPPKRSGKPMWIIAAAAVAVIVGLIALTNAGSSKGGAAPPEEQKYIGRLLPAKYEEPKVADNQIYSTTVKMMTIAPSQSGSQISFPVNDIVSKKIIYFDYKRADGQAIPMLAYVKPSGRLFAGVSFCPPCQGKGQRIEADITLTCETCGTKRNLETGVGISGACKLYPTDELAASVAGGKVVIDKAAIDNWTPQPKDRTIGG